MPIKNYISHWHIIRVIPWRRDLLAPTAPSPPSLITHPDTTRSRLKETPKSKLNGVFKLLQEFNWTLDFGPIIDRSRNLHQ